MANKFRFTMFRLIVFVGIFSCVLVLLSSYSQALINVRTGTVYPDTDTKVRVSWDAVYDSLSSVTYQVYRSKIESNQGNYTVGVTDNFTWTNIYEGARIDSIVDGEASNLTPSTNYIYKVITSYSNSNGGVTTDYGFSVVTTTSLIIPIIKSYTYNINSRRIEIELDRLSRAAKYYEVIDSVRGAVYKGSCDGMLDSAKIISFEKPYFLGNNASLRIMHSDGKSSSSLYSDVLSIPSMNERTISAYIENDYVLINSNVTLDSSSFKLQKSYYSGDVWSDWEDCNDSLISDGYYRNTIEDEKTYRYRLMALETSHYRGTSTNTLTVSKSTGLTKLSYSLVNNSRVKLSWINNGFDVNGIQVEKKENDGDFQKIGYVDRNATYYVDYNLLKADVNYTYRLSIYRIGTNSGVVYGPEIKISIANPKLKLRILAENTIELKWDNQLNDERGIHVERKTDNGGYALLTVQNMAEGVYSDNDISVGHTYKYRILVPSLVYFNKGYSNEVEYYHSGKIIEIVELEATPFSSSSIKLKWAYSDVGAKGTLIERKGESDTEYFNVAEVLSSQITFIDENIAPGKKYFYRVSAMRDADVMTAPYPSGDSVFAYTKPPKPTEVTGKRDDIGKVLISWKPVKNVQKYIILRKSSHESAYNEVETVEGNLSSWLDEDSKGRNKYKYQIVAIIDDVVDSEPSDELLIEQMEMPVANILYYMQEETLNFRFDPKAGYDTPISLEKKDEKLGSWVEIDSYVNGETILKDNSVTMGDEYTYRISAMNTTSKKTVYTDEIIVTIEVLEKPYYVRAEALGDRAGRVNWNYTSKKGLGFVIYRTDAKGNHEVGRTAKSELVFDDRDLLQNTEYQYIIYAIGDNIFSPPSRISRMKTASKKSIKLPVAFSWASNAVTRLNERGTIDPNMISNGNFYPRNFITRAEFLSILTRVCGFKKPTEAVFKDIDKNKWYYYDILRARSEGIISGSGNEYFNPSEKIIRQDMAVIISNAIKTLKKITIQNNNESLQQFSDYKEIDEYAKASVSFLIEQNIIKGSHGRLEPLSFATRAEAVTMINRIFEVEGVLLDVKS